MTRLPRRTLRVKPPLRGRASIQHYRGQFAPITAVRRPTNPGSASLLTELTPVITHPIPEIPPP